MRIRFNYAHLMADLNNSMRLKLDYAFKVNMWQMLGVYVHGSWKCTRYTPLTWNNKKNN